MPENRIARRLRVEGIVQGVGFRPFVARTAADRNLDGWVRNTGGGVTVHLEGSADAVEAAAATIRTDPPPLARIDSAGTDHADPAGADGFTIRASTDEGEGQALVPPDTGVCRACRADIRNRESPYHGYWATACVDCGPRFTVTRSLPYDRETTSMDAYPLCPDCRERYEDPQDRRFHAQTAVCPACGPEIRLVTQDGDPLASGREAVAVAADSLADGAIVGIKGTGGTHLACEATSPGVVEDLRERLGRPSKPFALMAPDLAAVEGFAHVDERERAILEDTRRPIVTLERRERGWLGAVAPGLHTVGVMLPYAGLHHLLFDDRDPLVMTSANRPGIPMATTTEGLLELDAVDAALVHDREIVARCDDSVVRAVDGERVFLRRSRGWVPRPLPGPDGGPTVLALGGEFDTTVAVSRDHDVVPGQHVGDVDGPAGLEAHCESTAHLIELLGAEPDVVACDLHPDFLTTGEAEHRADAPVRVQHHHAHAASLLGEHGRDRAVVIAVDGTGYGSDGTVWGGEVLVADRAEFERVGGLTPFGLPGGEVAVRYPARILSTLLADADRVDTLLADRGVCDGEATRRDAERVRRQVRQGVNCPTTTSAGRYLDAVAALLDVCVERRYEGQPAMELESIAVGGDPLDLELPYSRVDGRRCLDTPELVRWLADRAGTADTADVAATAQHALGTGLATIALAAAEERALPVGITGGVAVNEAIVGAIRRRVAASDRSLLTHDRVPPGDGGLSYGQALVALARQ
jgi:hydrogenase maturation protein HypF